LEVAALILGSMGGINAVGYATQSVFDGGPHGRLAENLASPFEELFVDLDGGASRHELIVTPLRRDFDHLRFGLKPVLRWNGRVNSV